MLVTQNILWLCRSFSFTTWTYSAVLASKHFARWWVIVMSTFTMHAHLIHYVCVCAQNHKKLILHPVTQLQNTPALTSGIWGTSTTWRPCCCFGTCGEMDTFWKHNGELAQRWTVCTLGRQSGWTSCVPSSDTGGVWYVCTSSPPVYWDRNCRVCGPSFLVLFCV